MQLPKRRTSGTGRYPSKEDWEKITTLPWQLSSYIHSCRVHSPASGRILNETGL